MPLESSEASMTPAQISAYVKSNYAFGLPNGSVRALLALITFGGIWGLMWLHPNAEVPASLRNLMFIIMGHYFAVRRDAGNDVGPAPLYLPRGTVRTLLLMGFAALAGALIYQHRMTAISDGHRRLNQAGVTMILVAGFMLGVLMSRFGHKGMPRYLEDLRAFISLASGVLLVTMLFGLNDVPDTGAMHELERRASHYRVADILAATIGFYFGSKS